MSLAFVESDALALGFGEPQVSSALGQPLRMRIPLHVDSDVDLTSQCVRLIGPDAGDPMPSLTQARLTLEEKGADHGLRIESMLPINEPILRVTVEAGCMQRVRREFVLLLDPPESATPNIVAGPVAAPSSALPTTGSNAPEGEIGLGIARIDSRVGQPLAMQIPLSGAGAATLAPECVHLASLPPGEGAPVLSQAIVSVARSGGQTSVEVTTPTPVQEPALRVVLEVGCQNPLRREYGVLLDASPAVAGATAQAEAPPSPSTPIPAQGAPAPTAEAPPAVTPTGEAPPPAPPAAGEAPVIAPTPPVAAAVPPAAAPQAAPAPGASTAPPAQPKKRRPHKPATTQQAPAAAAPAKPAAPAKVPEAPANAPVAANAPTPAPAAKPAVPAPAKAPAPEADHLVLAAPEDATATTLRLAEMDRRVQDLTKEITQLRSDLATERQRRSEVESQKQHGDLGWVVAALSLVGLVAGGLLVWHRNRTAGTWHGGSWSDIEPPPPLTKTGVTTVLKADKLASAAPPAPPAAPPPAPPTLRVSPKKTTPVPPPPRTIIPPATTRPPRETTGFSEVEVETTPGNMEITELQQNEPSLEKLRTLFNDVNEGNTTSPEDEVISGLGRLTVPLDLPVAPEGPVTRLPGESPNTEQGNTAFTFEESPLTQTPTLVALDLDLTTRLTPGADEPTKGGGEKPPADKTPPKGTTPGAKPGESGS